MQVNGEQVTLETPVSVADYREAHGFRAEPWAVTSSSRDSFWAPAVTT